MHPVVVPAILLATLAGVRSGEYCDDFESGDLGPFWNRSDLDSRGHWQPASYRELKKTIPDFPQPASGDTVVYLTVRDYDIYVYARLQMTEEYVFPNGSTISFRYWLRSDYPGSGTLEVRRTIGTREEKDPFLSLTETSGPNNTDWMEVTAEIPADSQKQKIIIFGYCANHQKNNIAVDDIRICGPKGLEHQCFPITTTTEITASTIEPTITEMTTTVEPTTTGMITTTEPTTTDMTTTTEPTTTLEPATSTAPTPPPSTGEYCDDFESDDFGLFWHQSPYDYGGHWKPASYRDLQQTVQDFPPPASGDTVVYLTLAPGSSFVGARLEMTAEFRFPRGSRLSFRYWLRSQYEAAAALYVKRVVGSEEDTDPILDLTATAGPNNAEWSEASVDIPPDDEMAKIIIFAACGSGPLDSVAIDDIRVSGPQGLDHKCLPMAVPME